MSKTQARRRGLEAILTGRLLAIAAVVILVNVAFVAFFDASDSDALIVDLAQRELVRLETALVDVDSDPDALVAVIDGIYDEHPDAYAFAVVTTRGEIVAGKNVDLIPPNLVPLGLSGRNWLIWQNGVNALPVLAQRRIGDADSDLGILFYIIEDPADLFETEILDEFLGHVWLPLMPIAVLLIGAAILVIQRALRPVDAAAAWARSIQPGKGLPPLEIERAPQEIVDLTEAVKRSIERLDSELVAEQRRAAEAAHALRTPVAVLVARIDELPEGAQFDTLRTDVEALSRTVTQFLTSSGADRLEVGDDAQADLSTVAHNVVTDLYPYAEAKGCEIMLTNAHMPHRVHGSDDAIALALTNLVENAIHHAGPGLIEVSVGPGPVLGVRDHGPGLPKNTHGDLFEPFTRGDGAPRVGAGLGLAIVARIQRAHHGRVDVQNATDGGAFVQLHYQPA